MFFFINSDEQDTGNFSAPKALKESEFLSLSLPYTIFTYSHSLSFCSNNASHTTVT